MAMRYGLAALLYCGTLIVSTGVAADDVSYITVPAGTLTSVLSNSSDNRPIPIRSFTVRTRPITNAQFQAFIIRQPEWQRDQIAAVFADSSYLKNWQSASTVGNQLGAEQPVTGVSWFAAEAFCESEQARLPTWYEWEYLAASDATHADARKDPAWRAKILAWYGRPTTLLGPVVGGAPNYYGVRDMHGLIWEWASPLGKRFWPISKTERAAIIGCIVCETSSVQQHLSFVRT